MNVSGCSWFTFLFVSFWENFFCGNEIKKTTGTKFWNVIFVKQRWTTEKALEMACFSNKYFCRQNNTEQVMRGVKYSTVELTLRRDVERLKYCCFENDALVRSFLKQLENDWCFDIWKFFEVHFQRLLKLTNRRHVYSITRSID